MPWQYIESQNEQIKLLREQAKNREDAAADSISRAREVSLHPSSPPTFQPQR